jgi:transcription elongation factor Elf1
MTCPSCGSTNESKLTAEIAIHFPGLRNLNKPTVWVFPEIFVCLDCGKARFVVPEAELRSLNRGDAATAR